MSTNKNEIINHILMHVKCGESVDEERIRNLVLFFKKIAPISVEEEEEVIKELHAKLTVKMDRGVCIKEKKHVPWYNSAKKNINHVFWNRYVLYLRQFHGFNNEVINALDNATDEMMDMLGNPNSDSYFSRRGLVIGDVQSGKTSTYTALINKAADAGYKIVILLTGTVEKLRRQTQSRLDAGFIGLDSTAFLRDRDNIEIGVGEIDNSKYGWSVTSTSSDFNTKTASQLNIKLEGIQNPILFVLKKNKSVLEKLEQWLRLYNAENNKEIKIPMLLIDDEADNASINTKKDEDSPTAINAAIRKLLKLFTNSNYVAFTATPFANIFINPDSEDEMLSDDLFPKDFIYALEAPTNYIGARSIFNENGKYKFMLKNNDDCEFYIPEKHKKEFEPGCVPESLKEAVNSFFIANAIRDLRGHRGTHRSMLINISRFISVQNKIADQVDLYVREIQREVNNYYKTGKRALQHKRIAYMKGVYDKHFKNLSESQLCGEKKYSWDEIQAVLYPAIASIVVRAVNGGNAPKNLNYDEYDDGLRIIAVGGFSLSRGLTLEGLCVSYFYRNSKMYDTLMQMGRWFGYRNHYADLCQIWMSENSADWYEYISTASDELRRDVRKMSNLGLTPKYFGLGVRSDKDSLLVTAINKMRYTYDIPVNISLNGKVVETPYIHMDKKISGKNLEVTEKWISSLIDLGYEYANPETENLVLKHPQILNVPKRYIIEFLNVFKSHYLNLNFRTEDIVSLLGEYNDGTVENWDIMIATGSGREKNFCGKIIKHIVRSFAVNQKAKAIQMSGKNSRLGSRNLAKGGLTEELRNCIEEEAQKLRSSIDLGIKNFSQDDYFNTGICRNPLLVIYPIELNTNTTIKNGKKENDNEKINIAANLKNTLIGLSIGIPSINGRENKTYRYRINLVKWKELLEIDDDFYEETGVED